MLCIENTVYEVIISINEKKTMIDEVRRIIRLKGYSISTERSYCDWIRRYAKYHNLKNKGDSVDGERKIEQFLTHLALGKNVAPNTQNQVITFSSLENSKKANQ